MREKGRQKPGLSPKSAQYIWSEVTSGFREAGDGALVNVPRADGKGGTSDLMRLDLEAAGLTRADLFRDDERHMPFTFHGLRHTAITHWAVAGRPQHWLLAVAGHVSPAMTRRYLDLAAVVRGKFGTPHPPLPAPLLARGKAGLFRVA